MSFEDAFELTLAASEYFRGTDNVDLLVSLLCLDSLQLFGIFMAHLLWKLPPHPTEVNTY